jgi:two-component system CheB/CheR fusion protein
VSVEERRAPVDIFFRTLGESHHARAVAVILSGTGADGSMGIKRVKERGGAAFVQNPREAEFSEMPRNSIATELIDAVLNVREIPAKIIAYKENLGTVEIPLERESRPEEETAALREIFTVLRVRTGHDFSNYKRPTVLRRIERRINVRELQTLSDYAAYIRNNVDEAHALLKDLLISVTNFFRDKEAFQFLEQEIVPRMLQDKTVKDEVRIWVAGCATGEEAYSLAMLLSEGIEGSPVAPAIQIFASDIDEAAITAAREGFYTINDAADVSPERLRRFFTKEGDGYRVRRELRQMILFANHNVLKDPPFSHLDLITCRNLLIYFNGTAQERAMETFHFALNPGAFLFLGSSESIDGSGDLYAPVNKELRIYQSRQAAARIAYPAPHAAPVTRYVEPKPALAATNAADVSQEQENRLLERISFGDLHQQMLEQYAPPSIVVNENYDVVHLSERAGRFLQIAGGEPSKNLLHLVRPELRLELRTALYQAVQRRANVVAPNLKVQTNGNTETINIHVRPVLRFEDTARGFLLVVFEQSQNGDVENQTERVITTDEPLARRLEEELERTKEQLRSSVEQFEVQTEELRASNEELQAINEELRSSTEELETSREELQSVNEELRTVNQELKIKIEELSNSNNDFQNLLNSTDIGTIFLDRSLRVKLFTPSVREVFNLIDADLNRPLADIATKLDFEGLQADVERVLDTLQTVEREFETDKGKWFLMRIFPYRTTEDRINGAVVTFIDITNRIRSEQALHKIMQSREQQTRIFDTALSSIADFTYTFDRKGRFTYANKPLLDLLGITLEEITGKTFGELPYPKDLADKLESQIEQVFETKKTVTDETPFTNPAGEEGFYEYIFTPVIGEDGTVEVVAGSTRVITERRRAEESIRFQAKLLNTVEQSVIATDLEGKVIFWNQFAEKLYGWTAEETIGSSITDLTTPSTAAEQAAEIMSLLRQGKSWSGEFQVKRRDGTAFPAQVFNSPINDSQGKMIGIVGVSIDISERKQAEQALLKSEERLRLLVESADDYAIFTVTKDNLVDSWNAGAERTFGWKENEIIGKSNSILFTREDRERGVPEMEIQCALETGKAEDERWHIRKDGTRFYASGVMQPLRNGGIHGFVKICRDQTDKIATEKALRHKEILQKLVGAQEDERKRIARDLHDHLGQQLTALRLKLDNAKKLCHDNDQLCTEIDETQAIAENIDADVDFLAWELRPAALDDLGLAAALKKYVKEWSRHTGIGAEFYTSGFDKTRLAPEVETNLYRITQEALNNVFKHAAAKSANVLLEKRGSLIVLIIEDDGKGFEIENKKNKDKGLGLVGMGERATLVGGKIQIESTLKEGTTIFVRIPI